LRNAKFLASESKLREEDMQRKEQLLREKKKTRGRISSKARRIKGKTRSCRKRKTSIN